ncbi:MAG: AAA family ATPase, partial [Desulfobacterales bacterium]|nr:AAA family ATPase [Desulfobacterales bacterium]
MPVQLLLTKLHKPSIPKHYLHRQRLRDKINQHRQGPFTLVSAPAGYGKSTLISSWLESCEVPSAWVSLDREDNDLNVFLSYLLAAVQGLFPDASCETRAMLKAAESPSVTLLARNLINELDSINESFIIVLDDYHVIKDKDLHYLLAELLKYPPKPLHLVVVSRRDPFLPLNKIRAKDQMMEIRANDLRFSNEESSAFLEKFLGVSLDKKTVAVVEKKTEGWITGLRLAVLTLRNQSDRDLFLKNLPEDNRYALDYILSEVLSKYSPVMQEYLLSMSILNRFSASLCEAVYTHYNTSNTEKMTGQEYIARLEQDNLFVIPLDDEQVWFRYHHLFQTLLQRLLKLRFKQDGINALHKRASEWFAENGLIEEALHHALDGGDTAFAVQLVAQNRHDLLNQEQWTRLRRWLNLLPHDCIEENPELLITQAWFLWNSMRFPEM